MRMSVLFAMAFGLAAITSTVSAHTPMTADTMTPPVDERYQPKSYITLKHPAWSKHAVLYQINTRQFTPECAFRAGEYWILSQGAR